VTHHGTDKARGGGRVYLALLIGTSMLLLLPALIFTWQVAGTTDFTPGGILDGKVAGAALAGLLALYMFGIGKAALMPFHRWLPAAMVAPTPVSALLHAVAVVSWRVQRGQGARLRLRYRSAVGSEHGLAARRRRLHDPRCVGGGLRETT
jgi:hypothetical protein